MPTPSRPQIDPWSTFRTLPGRVPPRRAGTFDAHGEQPTCAPHEIGRVSALPFPAGTMVDVGAFALSGAVIENAAPVALALIPIARRRGRR